MAKLPFSIFRRAGRRFYYVQFKNEKTGEYMSAISTKQETESGAVSTAFQWLKDGIPQKGEAVSLKKYSLRNMAREAEITAADCEYICKELQRRGMLKSYIISDSKQDIDFSGYLAEFWDWEKSAYIRERLRKNHGIHKAHCIRQGQAAARYWEPFFKGRILGDIIAADIDAFISHIGDKPLSAARKNSVILAGTKPLRWAFSKGKIEADPTRGHILFTGEEKERCVLSPTAAAAAFRVEWPDERSKLANMLAAVTGMRQGEILALRLQDLGPDCLYVRGSWGETDGLKLPKNNKPRTVELPFPDLLQGLIEQAQRTPWGVSPDSFVFWTEYKAGIPMQGRLFVDGLRDALIESGFSKGEARKYVFHGWRHFYTTYLMGKLEKKLLKSQTGHLTDSQLARYGEHRTEGDRQIIQATAINTFGNLLPDLRASGE